MRISRVRIRNFRNFKDLDVKFGEHAVIAGENKVGKSNFLYALQLVLDPSLSDKARELQDSDFWDGLPPSVAKTSRISISVELADFDGNKPIMSALNECLISVDPMVARITFEWRPVVLAEDELSTPGTYEPILFGGESEEQIIHTEFRRRLPIEVLQALRDAESDLASWKRSPLKPLLMRARNAIATGTLEEISERVHEATSLVTEVDAIAELSARIAERMENMVGAEQSIQASFGITPTDPDGLIKSLKLLIDSGKRGIADASLGSANLMFLTLRALELRELVNEGHRNHAFLGIEEPEAHLHPHLQRLVYRDFLRTSQRSQNELEKNLDSSIQTVILTTHSPHIVSVAPLSTIVLLRREFDEDLSSFHTMAYTPDLECLTSTDIDDIERYLDVTRAEMLFAKGVLLVEGEAEKYVVPQLARSLGIDLDRLGITVCTVGCADFLPYVKLLGKNGLNIPYAILTDRDPQPEGKPLGEARVERLMQYLLGEDACSKLSVEEIVSISQSYGVFLNGHTLEVDLFRSNNHELIVTTIESLTSNIAAKKRSSAWKLNPSSLDAERFLKDINEIGKGRFAQRLAAGLNKGNCPSYIEQAIHYLVARLKPETAEGSAVRVI